MRWMGSRLLAEWRARRGMTQVQAAMLIGVDQGRYSQYERGEARPGRARANRIATGTNGEVPTSAWDQEIPGDPAGAGT